ncbi:MAG: rRNA pseudouridine synthase [Oscillospiraceae bacterium]|nr:rRNA pseudouridine synthase [Oscillospiraceae bacterium]
MIRLDKYIADSGSLTRSQASKAIRDGRVAVNGTVVRRPEQKVDETRDSVLLDAVPVRYEAFHFYMLDKPAGILTASRDRTQKTVLDLFPPEIRKHGIFPVGRLDKETTGLLLLTDDGDTAHRILAPKSDISKVYEARVDGILTEEDMMRFREGLVLGDGTRCLPAGLKILDGNRALVTVREGKYHQVRRMLASVGKPVLELRRLSVGGLSLDPGSEPGRFRALDEEDLCKLFMTVPLEK